MKNHRKILLALDGSDQAMNAVRYISKLVPPESTEIELFSVVSKVPEPYLDIEKDPSDTIKRSQVWAEQMKMYMDNFMKKSVKTLVDAGFSNSAVTVKCEPRKVGVARDIINESANGFDAVVVGRSGLSYPRSTTTGSVAYKLVEAIRNIPVAVVGGKPEARSIYIAFDGSGRAMKGVNAVCTLMNRPNREVIISYVIRSLNIQMEEERVFNSDSEEEWVGLNKREIDASFKAAEKHLNNAGFHPANVFTKLIENRASRALAVVRDAEAVNAGTLIVGRRGLSSVETFVMGRVTRKIFEMATGMAVWII